MLFLISVVFKFMLHLLSVNLQNLNRKKCYGGPPPPRSSCSMLKITPAVHRTTYYLQGASNTGCACGFNPDPCANQEKSGLEHPHQSKSFISSMTKASYLTQSSLEDITKAAQHGFLLYTPCTDFSKSKDSATSVYKFNIPHSVSFSLCLTLPINIALPAFRF